MKFLPKAALAAALFAGTMVGSYSVAITPVVAETKSAASGSASYYGKRFHGRRTANGESFNMNSMTAAHKTLPFGTKVRVTNRRNGKSVVVRINDRGPYHGGRIIDLSRAAASKIGMIHSGTAKVSLDIL
ncbi:MULTISPECIES: septal ring lytic transglycosylase RlpA family protein [Aurantimonas]|jgi:rare lipoprotein A|uniref:septal ring lytic transglycosylase RlpA family protein n=2 Tax=Aurantimonadaceae TaxID=255475 RepID=UPI0003FFD5D3|nr:septal ring lytic transglycosylase RlpA family protein [Aurantimonas sp. DM33-3]